MELFGPLNRMKSRGALSAALEGLWGIGMKTAPAQYALDLIELAPAPLP